MGQCPCMPAVALYYCNFQGTVRLKMFPFLCLFFMSFIICVKSIINLIQHYTVNCVSWVPSLTLLNLQINWTYVHPLGIESVWMQGTSCILTGLFLY